MISYKKYQVIAELDFSAIKLKLTHQTSGEAWSQAKADAIETEYRRFLYLQSAFPGEQTAPTLDVDTFWHYHILDTMKYAADCDKVFGHFLHHYPYLGLMEGDEPGVEIKAGNRTRELYEATFGEAYIRAEAYGQDETISDAARCQGLCTVAAPQAQGGLIARCQGLCTVAAPKPKGAAIARCQGLCTVAAPKAQRAATARCQGLCTVAKPDISPSATARCQGLCTVVAPKVDAATPPRTDAGKPAIPGATGRRTARCQGLCTVAVEPASRTQNQARTGLPVIPSTVAANFALAN